MKQILLTGAMLTLTVAAIAGPPKDKTPATIKCAVMPDHTVNVKDATAKKMYADYKGNRYYFCCGGCPGQFKADPTKYAKAPHIKTPKDAAKS
jgi:YHS domain-containing protein